MLWWFFVVGDVVGWSKVEYSVQEALANGGIEFFDNKANKTVVFFCFNGYKHSITDAVLLHWLNLDALVILLLILSRIVLLILPILDLVGLVSRQVGLWAKFDLWSLSVMNDTVPSRIYVNCEDELHTLRRTVVRRTNTIVFRAQSKKMRNPCAFVIQCYKYLLYYTVE